MKAFWKKVKTLRSAKGWRQEDLAYQAGVSRSTIIAKEKAESPFYFRDKILRSVGAALGLSYEKLVDGYRQGSGDERAGSQRAKALRISDALHEVAMRLDRIERSLATISAGLTEVEADPVERARQAALDAVVGAIEETEDQLKAVDGSSAQSRRRKDAS